MTRLSGIRVLVVEDNPDELDLFVLVLEQVGANVLAADSAGVAVAALTRFTPDVILCDLRLGVGLPDGTDLLRAVRGSIAPERRRTPVVAVTGFARDYPAGELTAEGFDAVCSKPCSPQALVHLVSRLAAPAPERH